MADRATLALALLLTTVAPASAAPSPHPPMPSRDSAGAGLSALPLDPALDKRGEIPSLALVLGAGPETKVAALTGSRSDWRASRDADWHRQTLAIVLSALALSWIGPARRQAAYRWLLRR